jgi:hypothetical protein
MCAHCLKNFDPSAKSSRPSAYSVPREGGKCMLTTKQILWENHVNFVRDVRMIYAGFITIVVVFSGKRN